MAPRPLAAIGMLLLAGALAAGADWPQWRGPRRDGVSAETGLNWQWGEQGPPVLWRARVGQGFASVAVADGRLFTVGNRDHQDTVYCLDAETGRQIWTHAYRCRNFAYPGSGPTPTVDGDRVYVHSRRGDLLCLAAEDGEVLWQRQMRQEYDVPRQFHDYGNGCSPLIWHDLLIIEGGGPEALVVALDKRTGEHRWSFGRGGTMGYSSPVLIEHGGEPAVVMLLAETLMVLRPGDGREIDSFEFETPYRCNIATPLIDNRRILVSASYGSGAALFEIGRDEPLW